MHKHVAPRPNPSLIRAVTMLALIMAFIISGLAVITSQRPAQTPPDAAPPAVVEPITADPAAHLTAERVSVATERAPEPEDQVTAPPAEDVQAWTPEEPQVVIPAIPAPEVGTPVTSGVGCQEDNPCWDCTTMGNKVCSGTDTAPTTAPVCEEDMPCWDCATMGNLVCGTIDDSAEAWAAFDLNGGACLFDLEPRPFMVGYSASSTEYPQNMTANDVAVTDASGTWYVFTATYTDVPEDRSDFEEPADMT